MKLLPKNKQFAKSSIEKGAFIAPFFCGCNLLSKAYKTPDLTVLLKSHSTEPVSWLTNLNDNYLFLLAGLAKMPQGI
ncbi:hypothetical protein [Methylophaga nitratireducenticrescens]|uniref:hypothetical protein n=1 Tax=Methylophaga nitratireducenticrescens TaxID=754476 RepID=UPI000CDBF12E|nr:hypothetical protein [Methylophaga nitratireducenticrescens]AUZ85374.1 hypothetical protein CDW43_12725 [Methylophaga nitratireducenticrescens]